MADYNYNITNTGYDTSSNLTVGNMTWNDPYPFATSWYYSYPHTIYMYQVFCPKPRCKGMVWGELDNVVTCPKCGSTIKLVNQPAPDYEIEVNKGA